MQIGNMFENEGDTTFNQGPQQKLNHECCGYVGL